MYTGFVLTDAGSKILLGRLTNLIDRPLKNFVVKLAVNQFTPDVNTNIGQLVECSVPGYVPLELIGGLGAPITSDGAGVATQTWNTLATNFLPYPGPVQTLFGFWVQRQPVTPPIVVGSGLFPVPIPVPLVGLDQPWIALARLRQRVMLQ